MPFGGLGMWEVFLILLVLLLVFGPRRLPELGGALGKGIREFKRSVSDLRSELTQSSAESKELKASSAAPALDSGVDAAPQKEQAEAAKQQ